MCEGDTDERVVPSHSLKLAAMLQWTPVDSWRAPQQKPVLLRVTPDVGHSEMTTDIVDFFSFAANVCGAAWVYRKPL